MNWGHKIIIVIVVFIIGMLTMVTIAYQQTNDMVDTNYYEKELKYQLRIDAAHNLATANRDSVITQNRTAVLVRVPRTLMAGFEKGKIEFIKNDDKKKDINLPFTPDSDGVFSIDRSRFSQGLYKARVQWESDGKNYYKEQDFSLQQ